MCISIGLGNKEKTPLRQSFINFTDRNDRKKNPDRFRPPSPSTTPRKPQFPLNFRTISSSWFVAFSRMCMRIETVWSVVSLFNFSVNVFRCGTFPANAHAYWRKAIMSCSDNLVYSGCTFILVVVFQLMHINTHAYCNNFLLLSQSSLGSLKMLILVVNQSWMGKRTDTVNRRHSFKMKQYFSFVST